MLVKTIKLIRDSIPALLFGLAVMTVALVVVVTIAMASTPGGVLTFSNFIIPCAIGGAIGYCTVIVPIALKGAAQGRTLFSRYGSRMSE